MTTPRTVHALQFDLVADQYRAIIVWPEDALPLSDAEKARRRAADDRQGGY